MVGSPVRRRFPGGRQRDGKDAAACPGCPRAECRHCGPCHQGAGHRQHRVHLEGRQHLLLQPLRETERPSAGRDHAAGAAEGRPDGGRGLRPRLHPLQEGRCQVLIQEGLRLLPRRVLRQRPDSRCGEPRRERPRDVPPGRHPPALLRQAEGAEHRHGHVTCRLRVVHRGCRALRLPELPALLYPCSKQPGTLCPDTGHRGLGRRSRSTSRSAGWPR